MNLVGQAAPLLVGVFTIPHIISGLGVERFGLLSLVWMFLGYFSLFDFGLSRSITLFVSQALAEEKRQNIGPLFWSSCLFIFALSLIGSALIATLSFDSAISLLKISPELKHEAQAAILMIALTLPIVTLSTALKGLLEAAQKFALLNTLQIINGIYTFLTPLLAFKWSLELPLVVALLSLGRTLIFLAHIPFCLSEFPEVRRFQLASKSGFSKTLHFGGWLTISNIVGPVMIYFDRFFLSAMVPAAQIAFYTTPYEVISRFLIIPASLTRALFPTLSFENKENLYKVSLRSITLVAGLMCLSVLLGARPALELWLGAEFATQSSLILQILAIGVFFNSLAWIPFTLIQSLGRSELTAKIHLFELPIYLLLLLAMITHFGILGAAIAWSTRTTLDCAIMFMVVKKLEAKWT